MSVTKKEAFDLCQNRFIYDYPKKIMKLYDRAEKKIRQAVREKTGMTCRQYTVHFDILIQESGLFSNDFIKEFFKHLLEDAYAMGQYTIYNDTGLSYFFYEAINAFQPYYTGNLTQDARAIQARIVD
jgi:hypothetical protein